MAICVVLQYWPAACEDLWAKLAKAHQRLKHRLQGRYTALIQEMTDSGIFEEASLENVVRREGYQTEWDTGSVRAYLRRMQPNVGVWQHPQGRPQEVVEPHHLPEQLIASSSSSSFSLQPSLTQQVPNIMSSSYLLPASPQHSDNMLECVICQDPLHDMPAESLACGHTFHHNCLNQYCLAANKNRTCCCPFKCFQSTAASTQAVAIDGSDDEL